MEKEIKVRKKRFAAFWVAVLLLCMLVMPQMTQKAEALVITDPVENQEIPVNEPITNSDGGCTVYYLNRDGAETIWDDSIGYGETHYALGADASELAGLNITEQEELKGWKVKAIANDSGFVDKIYLSPIIEEVIRTYTITFDTDGGNTIGPIIDVAGTAITAPDNPEKTGYTFTGWDPQIPDTMPAADLVITAKWIVNQYTITFDTAGGGETAKITQDYGSAVTAPVSPTREGHSFTGWDTEIPSTMPAKDLTITALWVPNTYYIRYELDDAANGNNPPTYTYGTGVPSLAAAVKPGYIFDGWYSDDQFQNRITEIGTTATEDRTLYAKFTTVVGTGTYDLLANISYTLGSGVTKVSGDSSTYTSGSTFYVPADGSYTFN